MSYAHSDLSFNSDFLEKCRFCSIDQFFITGAEIWLPSINIETYISLLCQCTAVTGSKLHWSCFYLRSSHKIPVQPGGQTQCPFLMSHRAPFWQSSHVKRQPGPIYPGGQAETAKEVVSILNAPLLPRNITSQIPSKLGGATRMNQ